MMIYPTRRLAELNRLGLEMVVEVEGGYALTTPTNYRVRKYSGVGRCRR